MLTVVQRVARASVTVEGRVVGRIDGGLAVLVGVHRSDEDADVQWMAERLVGLRVFGDESGKMNLSMAQVGAGCLLIPNFTLCAQTGKGHRPSFTDAMEPGRAKGMFEMLCLKVAASGVPTGMGVFGADMKVELLNDGPVTVLLDSSVNRKEPG